MNWFTHAQFKTATKLSKNADYCEHLAENPEQPCYVETEMDTFGIVDKTVVCKACHDAQEADKVNQTEWCDDCFSDKPLLSVSFWKTWDHSDSCGDQPIQVCDECAELPRHLKRVADDNKRYQQELEYNHDDDDY